MTNAEQSDNGDRIDTAAEARRSLESLIEHTKMVGDDTILRRALAVLLDAEDAAVVESAALAA